MFHTILRHISLLAFILPHGCFITHCDISKICLLIGFDSVIFFTFLIHRKNFTGTIFLTRKCLFYWVRYPSVRNYAPICCF